jgi:hypothetical protein
VSERTITTALLIRELCRELHMTEEQLLVHLAIEYAGRELSEAGQRRVLLRARSYTERGIFTVESTRL